MKSSKKGCVFSWGGFLSLSINLNFATAGKSSRHSQSNIQISIIYAQTRPRKLISNNNAGINLTGYHPPPRLTPRPLIFPSKSTPPGQLFSAKLRPPGRKNETKIPTPGHNLPGSNAKRINEKGT